MAKCEKILIAGFSGAGKSSFLKEIAGDTPFGWQRFDDLDALIEKKYKTELPILIQLEGWEAFRKKERDTLLEWLQGDFRGVLALGGGTLTRDIYPSLILMKQVRLVHLEADFETCWARLNQPLAPVRPLMQKGKVDMQKIFQERAQVYDLITWRLKNPEGTNLKALGRRFWQEVLLP